MGVSVCVGGGDIGELRRHAMTTDRSIMERYADVMAVSAVKEGFLEEATLNKYLKEEEELASGWIKWPAWLRKGLDKLSFLPSFYKFVLMPCYASGTVPAGDKQRD